MERAIGLAWQALDGLVYGWKISAILVVLVVVALPLSHPFRAGLKRRHALLIVPFFVPVVIDLWATVFEHQPGTDLNRVPAWQVTGVFVIALAVLPISAAMVYRSRGYRWVATAVSAVAIWTTVWFYFVGGMSVTGSWL